MLSTITIIETFKITCIINSSPLFELKEQNIKSISYVDSRIPRIIYLIHYYNDTYWIVVPLEKSN